MYFKKISYFKKLSVFLAIAILIWPLMFTYLSPANLGIATFIIYMSDTVILVNKSRKMAYSEYKLIKGTDPTNLKSHCWLISVILIKLLQLNCHWVCAMSMHMYSPLFGLHIDHRLGLIYASIVCYIILDVIYIKCYKKWVTTYVSLSTNEAESILPVT